MNNAAHILDEILAPLGTELVPAATTDEQGSAWSFSRMRGRWLQLQSVEGSGMLTAACVLMRGCIHSGRLVAWIGDGISIPYVPDWAHNGIDLASVVFVNPAKARNNLSHDQRTALGISAAQRLLRCNAFGLVVLDQWLVSAAISPAVQQRLARYCGASDSLLLQLCKGTAAPSRTSLAQARWQLHAGPAESQGKGMHRIHCRSLRDKRLGPNHNAHIDAYAPPGLY